MKTNGLIQKRTQSPTVNQPTVITSPAMGQNVPFSQSINQSVMSATNVNPNISPFPSANRNVSPSPNARQTIMSSSTENLARNPQKNIMSSYDQSARNMTSSNSDKVGDMGYFTASDARKRYSASEGILSSKDDETIIGSRGNLDEERNLDSPQRYDSSQDSLLSPPTFQEPYPSDISHEKPAVLPRKLQQIGLDMKQKTQRPLPPEPQCTDDGTYEEPQCAPYDHSITSHETQSPRMQETQRTPVNNQPLATWRSETPPKEPLRINTNNTNVESGVETVKSPCVKDIIRTLQTESFKDPNYGVPFGLRKEVKMTLKDLDISPPKTQAPVPPLVKRRGSKTGKNLCNIFRFYSLLCDRCL